MTNEYLTVLSDTRGYPVTPTEFGDHFNLVQSIYISALFSMESPENEKNSFSEFVSSNERPNLKLGHEDFSRTIATYSELFKLSPFHRFYFEEYKEKYYDGDFYSIRFHERFSIFNHMFSRYYVKWDYSSGWQRKSEIDRLLVKSIQYSNPFEFKLNAERTWKALLVALVISGGELNFKEGYAKLPGLVDVTERITRLVIEVLDANGEREKQEIINEYLNSATTAGKLSGSEKQ